LLLALYRPLNEVLSNVSEKINYEAVFPGAMGDFVREHIQDYEEERVLAAKTERFGAIQDEVSQDVAAHYEANPYPRWVTMQPVSEGARIEHVKAYFTEAELSFMDRPFEVLIAGCATGAQAIRCALGYGKNANVVAVDLSLASLAYAQRMARKYNASNIRFMQADILELPKLAQKFDVIESTGVLLLLADPFKGFQVVANLLKPGGLFYCGLYAELARQGITRLHRDLAEQKISVDADYIRRYRHEMELASDPGRIWLSEEPFPFERDFFSLSNCRDLLFNFNDHVFTIPMIKEYLDRLGLGFRGFIHPPLLANRYWSKFPSVTDLDGWWEFEQKNPDTFSQMYEFWCLKGSQRSA
jgi:SAM-dependent methyltransferase